MPARCLCRPATRYHVHVFLVNLLKNMFTVYFLRTLFIAYLHCSLLFCFQGVTLIEALNGPIVNPNPAPAAPPVAVALQSNSEKKNRHVTKLKIE